MQNKPDIYGLILTGGFSKRMGMEKAQLNYHGKPQFSYLFELIKPFCEEGVFVVQKGAIITIRKSIPNDF